LVTVRVGARALLLVPILAALQVKALERDGNLESVGSLVVGAAKRAEWQALTGRLAAAAALALLKRVATKPFRRLIPFAGSAIAAWSGYRFTEAVGEEARRYFSDLAAGTVVVRERSGLRTPTPVAFAVPAGLESLAATLDVTGLSTADHSTIRSFLLRAPSLPADVRARIAASMATTIAAKVRTPVPPGVPPEAFLHAVMAVDQARAVREPPRDWVIGRGIPGQSPNLGEGAGDGGGGDGFAPPT
jgi:uncharacterized protein (DUF697 family)